MNDENLQFIIGKEHKYWWKGTARAPAVETPIEPPNETMPMEKGLSSGSDYNWENHKKKS